MVTQEFYEKLAEECAREAAGAKLTNVRDRALRSQAAWQNMADRISRANTMRAANSSTQR